MNVEERNALVRELDVRAQPLRLFNIDGEEPQAEFTSSPSIARLRRARRRIRDDPAATISLQETNGVLSWGALTPPPLAGRRRGLRRRGEVPTGSTVAQYRFSKLPPNEIYRFLANTDLTLTPRQGLLTLDDAGVNWLDSVPPPSRGRLLVLIHGTFSSCSNFLEELRATPDGKAWLTQARNRYDTILSFGHPTLSVSPIANALDLAQQFNGNAADIDVIAHSRGGLVARWWLDAFCRDMSGRKRVVLVGSPMSGTNLASPARIKASLDLLTNIGNALRVAGALASSVAPFLQVPLALLRVFTSVTGVLSKTPIADAAIALVPGIAGQSRVSNNPELERLRRFPISGTEYGVVVSNFESPSPGWKFWEYFRNIKNRIADLGTNFIFDGENDLVVDKTSMSELLDGTAFDGASCDFGTSEVVHHTNYFRQKKALDFAAEFFGWDRASSSRRKGSSRKRV